MREDCLLPQGTSSLSDYLDRSPLFCAHWDSATLSLDSPNGWERRGEKKSCIKFAKMRSRIFYSPCRQARERAIERRNVKWLLPWVDWLVYTHTERPGPLCADILLHLSLLLLLQQISLLFHFSSSTYLVLSCTIFLLTLIMLQSLQLLKIWIILFFLSRFHCFFALLFAWIYLNIFLPSREPE